MEEERIIALYWERAENAIAETARKYGKLCYHIAFNILAYREDSEECVNDTYLKAWNAIPPQRPRQLSAYLCRITRNLALDRYEKRSAEKRGGGEILLALDELTECMADPHTLEQQMDYRLLTQALNAFLETLPGEQRRIFLQRYWSLNPVKEIARDCHISESKVKVTLYRTREKLKKYLEQEGIFL